MHELVFLSRRTIQCIVSYLLISCSTEPAFIDFPFEVQVRTPSGQAVSGVDIKIDDKPAGRTDGGGKHMFKITGQSGDLHTIQIACPEGFTTTKDKTRFRLRSYTTVSGQDEDARPIIHGFHCAPDSVRVALVVDARGYRGLPVVVGPQRVATTNENGIAHAILDMAPEQQFTVMIDTQDSPKLEPQSPFRTFHVGQSDAVYTMAQDFHVPAVPKPKPKRRAPARPQRIPMPIR